MKARSLSVKATYCMKPTAARTAVKIATQNVNLSIGLSSQCQIHAPRTQLNGWFYGAGYLLCGLTFLICFFRCIASARLGVGMFALPCLIIVARSWWRSCWGIACGEFSILLSPSRKYPRSPYCYSGIGTRQHREAYISGSFCGRCRPHRA